MKDFMKKCADIIGIIFGYGTLICLTIGALSFFVYLAALVIGGETATAITTFIYKEVYPKGVLLSTALLLLGMLKLYLNGEMKNS